MDVKKGDLLGAIAGVGFYTLLVALLFQMRIVPYSLHVEFLAAFGGIAAAAYVFFDQILKDESEPRSGNRRL